MSLLSEAQLVQFDRDGFLILRQSECKLAEPRELQQWTNEVHQLPQEHGKWMPYEEVNTKGERQLMRTENFADFHEQFHGLLHGERLASILKQLSGNDMVLFKDKINYKAPHGNGFGAHLDAPAYDHIGRIDHLTANIAVDAATPENGCLQVVPGSHKQAVQLSHGGAIHPDWEAAATWIQVPLEPGDVLFFGSHLAHRSAPNTTDKSRASVYATYYSTKDGPDLRQRYYEHRRENFPPDHERVPGKDYGSGWKTYAFAAPFTQVSGGGPPERTVV